MTTRDELDALSSRELHDLAVRRALHHVDVEFLWELAARHPGGRGFRGELIEAGRDITKVTALLGDAIDSGEGDVAEALRPLYIDYLAKHGTSADAGHAVRPFGLVPRGRGRAAGRGRDVRAGLVASVTGGP